MVTKDQVMDESIHEFHYSPRCSAIHVAKAQGRKSSLNVERWRRNGQVRTWKTRPDEWKLPIKWGLHQYSYLTDGNAHEFHAPVDCPLNVSDESHNNCTHCANGEIYNHQPEWGTQSPVVNRGAW